MYRSISIHAVLNGFIVLVGCQRVVFKDAPDLLFTLKRYFEAPEAVEREFMGTAHAKQVPTGLGCQEQGSVTGS